MIHKDRYRRPLTLLAALIITSSPLVVLAQDSWQRHTRAGEMAFTYGNFELAEKELRAALELAQQLPEGNRRIEVSLDNLARLLEHQQRWDEAQPMYELLLAAQEHRLGKQSPELLDALAAAGRVSLRAADPPTAEAHMRRYIELATGARNANKDELRAMLSTLSRMCVLQERTEEALDLQRQAVALLGESRMMTTTEQAAELETLAQLELLHGDTERARQLLLDAIDLRREDDKTISPAWELVNAASTAYAAGEPELAAELANQARAARDSAEHLLAIQTLLADVAWLKVRRARTGLEEMIAVASDSPELSAAEELLTGLLQLQQAEPEIEGQVITTTLTRLVQVRALRGDMAGASATQQQLVESCRASACPALSKALNDLVTLLVASGRGAEAISVNAELIGLIETRKGDMDPSLLPFLNRQMDLLKANGRKKETKPIKKRIKQLAKAAGLR
jgi:hypothetical protein